jgi:hypothetical protein
VQQRPRAGDTGGPPVPRAPGTTGPAHRDSRPGGFLPAPLGSAVARSPRGATRNDRGAGHPSGAADPSRRSTRPRPVQPSGPRLTPEVSAAHQVDGVWRSDGVCEPDCAVRESDCAGAERRDVRAGQRGVRAGLRGVRAGLRRGGATGCASRTARCASRTARCASRTAGCPTPSSSRPWGHGRAWRPLILIRAGTSGIDRSPSRTWIMSSASRSRGAAGPGLTPHTRQGAGTSVVAAPHTRGRRGTAGRRGVDGAIGCESRRALGWSEDLGWLPLIAPLGLAHPSNLIQPVDGLWSAPRGCETRPGRVCRVCKGCVAPAGMAGLAACPSVRAATSAASCSPRGDSHTPSSLVHPVDGLWSAPRGCETRPGRVCRVGKGVSRLPGPAECGSVRAATSGASCSSRTGSHTPSSLLHPVDNLWSAPRGCETRQGRVCRVCKGCVAPAGMAGLAACRSV